MTAREELARLLQGATPGPWRLRMWGNEPPYMNDQALIVWLRNHAEGLLQLWEAADKWVAEEGDMTEMFAALVALEGKDA